MKFLSILFCFAVLFLTFVYGDEKDGDKKLNAKLWGDFHDPRQIISLYEWIRNGKAVEEIRPIDKSILIICWMPAPKRAADDDFVTYQISGVEGYHTEAYVKRFLDEFYALDHQKKSGNDHLNVLVAGNNWGAGIQLKEKLQALSKKHSFSVFFAGGWGFQKAVLIDEPEDRLALIQEAGKRATKREQGGVDQPAAAPQSKAK